MVQTFRGSLGRFPANDSNLWTRIAESRDCCSVNGIDGSAREKEEQTSVAVLKEKANQTKYFDFCKRTKQV